MSFDPKQHMMSLKGKEYLPVAMRLVWFRDEHPDWGIVTTPVEINTEKQYAIFSAQIFNADGKLMATATKMENIRGFADYVEKAETGSVGRALAYCGYGTQFAPELEEGERLADSPQPSENRPATAQNTPAQQRERVAAQNQTQDTDDPERPARIAFVKEAKRLGYVLLQSDGKTIDSHKVFDLLRRVLAFAKRDIPDVFVFEHWEVGTMALADYSASAASPAPDGALFPNVDETASARNYTDEAPKGGKRR